MIDQEEPENQPGSIADVDAAGSSDGDVEAAVISDADPQVDRVDDEFPRSDRLLTADSPRPDVSVSYFDEPASALGASRADRYESLQPPSNWDFGESIPSPPPSLPEHEPQLEAPLELPFVPLAYVADAPQETVRQTGLAWSMGIVFFGSVAFMLFLGWLADLLLGSSPWGIVLGVIIGSGIGFVQFFRISSQIHAPKTPDNRSFLSKDD